MSMLNATVKCQHFGGGEFSLKPAWTRELILWQRWQSKPVGCKQQHNSKIK